MKPLQSGSIAVYDSIERRYSLEGQSPSIMQIMQDTGFTSKGTVAHHLDRLEQAGWIIREPKTQHTIIPVHYPRVHYRRAAAGLHPTDTPNSDDSPSGRNADLDRFVQRQPITDVYAEWKSNADADTD